jgi:hypothetical protein
MKRKRKKSRIKRFIKKENLEIKRNDNGDALEEAPF